MLLKKQHEAIPEIQKQVSSLIVKWNELLQTSNELGKGLEDILKFNEEVDKVESWIREKVCDHQSFVPLLSFCEILVSKRLLNILLRS